MRQERVTIMLSAWWDVLDVGRSKPETEIIRKHSEPSFCHP
ncbi:hypothetical protein M2323_004643 [Rhodoblastus acidophilus]|nr:hypothetical protein [Rhodoblastus acidophilus]MCW2335691.1 hypothetical protein [Rhodoblastus acidophilus]